MTKVIILGEAQGAEPEKKNIEFVEVIDTRIEWIRTQKPDNSPNNWENIELICRSNEVEKYDIMFAYDGDRSWGCLYLGFWNDGVV